MQMYGGGDQMGYDMVLAHNELMMLGERIYIENCRKVSPQILEPSSGPLIG